MTKVVWIGNTQGNSWNNSQVLLRSYISRVVVLIAFQSVFASNLTSPLYAGDFLKDSCKWLFEEQKYEITQHKREKVSSDGFLEGGHSIVVVHRPGGAELIEEVGELTDDQAEWHSRPGYEESQREHFSYPIWLGEREKG